MQSSDSAPDVSPFAPKEGQVKPLKLTQEEMRVIRDCNRESFYKRCIPLGSILGLGTLYSVRSGFLKANAKFGATPKVVAAVIFGYFIGKISYQEKCAEKLMQLPNSQLGEVLRQRRRGNLQDSLDSSFGAGLSLAPFGNISSSETYSDMDYHSNLDLSTHSPQMDGLDETYRPSLDNPIYEEEMPPIQKNTTTYEELRKKNREEYQQKRIGNYKEPVSSKIKTNYQPSLSPSSNVPAGKNKYGDDME